MKSKQYLYSIFLIIVVFAFAYFFVNVKEKALSNSDAGKVTVIATNSLALSNKKMAVDSGYSSSQISVSSSVSGWSPMGDSVTAERIKAWFASRGNYSFYGPEVYSEYQDYDVATLMKLDNNGDLRAMHVLADRAETLQERKSILYKAAIYGSTEALARIAGIQDLERRDSARNYEEKKAALFDVLAYQKVAEIRGDWWPNIQMKDYYLKQYKIELTPQDYEVVGGIADEIFKDMQRQRRSLGLDDFDNSVPDEVIKFYEEMLRPL